MCQRSCAPAARPTERSAQAGRACCSPRSNSSSSCRSRCWLFTALPAAQRWSGCCWRAGSSMALQAGQPLYLGAVTLVVYGCGPGAGEHGAQRRGAPLLAAGLVAVLGSLFAFKFYDFLAGEIERALALVARSRCRAWASSRRPDIPSTPSRLRAMLIDRSVRRLPGERERRASRALHRLFPEDLRRPHRARDGFAAAVLRPVCAPIRSGWCWACS